MKRLVSNPRFLGLAIALIVVSGLTALQSLPRLEDPRPANRTAAVITALPGASAERVEALVTEKLESKLREIPEVNHIDSLSKVGVSVITIELHDRVAMDQTSRIWSEVRDELGDASALLPEMASEPNLDDQRAYAYTLIAALTGSGSAGPDMRLLGRYAEELQSRLRNVAGTDYVKIHGLPEEEIVVDVDLAKATSLGLTASDVGRVILGSDAKVSAGEINNRNHRVSVEVQGELDTLERIRKIPLRRESSGAAARVADVAKVTRQPKQPASNLSIVNGQRAVVLGIRVLPSERADLWEREVKAELGAFAAELPAGVQVEVLFNQERYTAERLGSLVKNVFIGFFLIASVLLLTLGWRSAVLVACALPLTVFFVFSCMRYTGLPIQQMTVSGLIVALGIMVDNAIVMVDTVDRFRRRGFGGAAAAVRAIRHLWLPLLGSTLTTILTFLPIVLMPGPAGEFVGGIALTVIFSLIGSYLISHLLVSGIAAKFLVGHPEQHWLQTGLKWGRLPEIFKASIAWALSRPRRVIGVSLALPALAVVLAGFLPEQFFPPADRDMINMEVYLPGSASVVATQKLTEEISEELGSVEGIESLHWFIGSNAPMFYYNLLQRRDGSSFYAQAMLTTDHFSRANRLVPELQRRLDKRFPQAQIILRRLEQGPPFKAPVELRIVGPRLEQLRDLGEQVRRIAFETEDVVHVRDQISLMTPKAWLALSEERVQSGQMSLNGVAEQLRGGLEGVLSGSVLEQTQSLPVRVRMADQSSASVAELGQWSLAGGTSPVGSSGTPVSALGDVELRPALGLIPRRDGERINAIEVYPRDGVLAAVVLQRIQERLELEGFTLPGGYRLEVGGESEGRNKAVRKLLGSVGVVAVLLFVVVVMSFNSFRLSTIILTVAAQAAGMGVLSLSLSGYPFGFTSIIGLMGLIGLAINAAIVIIAEIRSSTEAVGGNRAAIVESVLTCGRHIGSTTVTTVMGFVPLLIGGGGFWPPFAIVIAGGTVLTTLVSFYFVPALFILWAERRPFVSSEPVPAT